MGKTPDPPVYIPAQHFPVIRRDFFDTLFSTLEFWKIFRRGLEKN
jgi:hypothetical protein